MKKTAQRIEYLAAEYVLGSLTGGARRRFERWMIDSHQVRQEVWFWEAKLGDLGSAVPTQEPPSSVWTAIEQRLWATDRSASKSRTGWLWPTWSALASMASVVMLVLWLAAPNVPTDATPRLAGAVLEEHAQSPLWVISERGDDMQLNLRTVAASQAAAGKDYELWIVPKEGAPISLGVIPVGGTATVALTPVTRAALQESRTLAISLEPQGGSPTGAPTGPILHMTRLYEI